MASHDTHDKDEQNQSLSHVTIQKLNRQTPHPVETLPSRIHPHHTSQWVVHYIMHSTHTHPHDSYNDWHSALTSPFGASRSDRSSTSRPRNSLASRRVSLRSRLRSRGRESKATHVMRLLCAKPGMSRLSSADRCLREGRGG